MNDYIERLGLLAALSEIDYPFSTFDDAFLTVQEAPAVDVASIVHSYWIKYPRAHYFKCANCKYTVPYKKACLHNGKREYNYCPSCGAKMDLEEHNNEN